MLAIVEGKVWKFGDNIDTDQIIPAEYLVTPDMRVLAEHAFEKVRPGFAKEVRKGDILVAGANFGCGSSREHAPRALMGAGISCVIAKSFARIFFRNSINIGFPLVEADVEAEDGDRLKVDFNAGIITNLSSGKTFVFRPYVGFVRTLIEKGGLLPYTKAKLAEEKRS
jgi:3-isopropylmalate dehydratase small subunit